MTASAPVIDLTDWHEPARARAVARELDAACRDTGFFCIVGHGIDAARFHELDAAARRFFALAEEVRAEIAMPVGGSSWRGWFPLGGEVTNGIPDRKEGIYFGEELDDADPRVVAGLPLHGRNLFPTQVPELRVAVLEWMTSLTELGHGLLAAIGRGLGLPDSWFRSRLTADPTVLFRIFRYPPVGDEAGPGMGEWGMGEWGVAEHTDYGLLTMLVQDDRGGLQVRGRSGWVDVEPIPSSFVCNIGDMLERMTGGRYRSTPHRVRNSSGRDRLSFPFFFDPSWNARVVPLPLEHEPAADDDDEQRWDGRSVFDFDGTYGEYLVDKVSKVFPDLVHVI